MSEVVQARRTERLVLRGWRDGDRDAWAAMNADPEVMRYFHDTLTREQSDAMLDRMDAALEAQGWGLWALERLDTGELVGFTGLAVPTHDLPFQPCVEVGWRLARSAWGRGFATEAAREALRVGFDEVGLAEVVSMTSVPNTPSRAVMERLGMTRDPADDFEHPAVPPGHPLRPHVLYRLRADAVRYERRSGAAARVVAAQVLAEDAADHLGLRGVLAVDAGEQVVDVGGGAVVLQVGPELVEGRAGLAALAELVLDGGPECCRWSCIQSAPARSMRPMKSEHDSYAYRHGYGHRRAPLVPARRRRLHRDRGQ